MSTVTKFERHSKGEMRASLVDAAVEVMDERGVQGFSLAEASRRLGIPPAASYRRFADRDELLAAVASRGLHVYAAMLSEAEGPTAERRLAETAGVYVRFAARYSALFDAIYNLGLDTSRYPELQRGWAVVRARLAVVDEVCAGDSQAAKALTGAIDGCAHGYAMLLIGGEYGPGEDAVEAIAARAVAAAQALILGRQELVRGSCASIASACSEVPATGHPATPAAP